MPNETKLSYHLHQLYLLYNKKALLKPEVPAGEDFSRSHYEVMLLLDDLGERPMSVVAKSLSYSKAYITSIADNLYKKGYIIRVPSQEDRRVILISLTESGRNYLNAYRESIEKTISKRLTNLSPDDTELMTGMAAEMVRILSKLQDSEDARYIRHPVERRVFMSQTTTKYFPVLVDSRDKIPDEFAREVEDVIGDGPLPYCVHIPGYVNNGVVSKSWFLLLAEDSLTVLEGDKNVVSKRRMDLQEIFYLERGCVLLYSWIELKAQDAAGVADYRIEFNTVREDLMLPVVERIRMAYSPAVDTEPDPESAFDFLRDTNLKFFNFAEQSLLPHRKIGKVIYQPEITKPILHVFRKSIQDAHLTLITPEEVVDIVETGRVDAAGTRNQGAVWRFIPRKSIRGSVVVDGPEPDTAELMLELQGNQSAALIFAPERKPILEECFHA